MPDRYEKLLEAGLDHLRASPQRPRDADKLFRQILAKAPKHFMANYGHLVVLHCQELTEKNRRERVRYAHIVLDNAPKKPKGIMEELAMRYAANTIAYDIFSREKTPERLREALRFAEIGEKFDPHYDDQISLVTGTKAEILMALGREEEAYALAEKVLEKKPSYPDFVTIARTSGYKRWKKAREANRRTVYAELIGDDLATDLNCAMLARVELANQNKKRAPLSREIIDSIRIPKARGDRKATLPLPPSVKALLAYDAHVVFTWRPVFEPLLGKNPGKGKLDLSSTTMTDVFRASTVAKGYRDLKKSAEADMPALIELQIGSDQRVFLYVADSTRDENGEYPIVRFDDEPCIWMTAGCLQDEILRLSNDDIDEVPGAAKRLRNAKKAIGKWLAREPEQRFVETDD